MKILVLNTGSSSVKFSLYDSLNDALMVKGGIDRLGSSKSCFSQQRFYTSPDGAVEKLVERTPSHVKNVKHAIPLIIDFLLRERFVVTLEEIEVVGHRVVHGGEKYKKATVVTRTVIQDIQKLSKLAPLHCPNNLLGIELCQKLLKAKNIAVFDTSFHQTMPRQAFLYGIPRQFYKKHRIRKYGFHGINHKYCSLEVKEILGTMPEKLITCHLGNGSSVTAIKNGHSIDTSMGFTPTDGLIMGTRSGALDPEVVLYLLRELHKSPKRIHEFLNKESGLASIAGSSDMRDIWRKAQEGDDHSRLAIEMLAYDVAGYIGNYAAALDGLDCLVFTGGIGEDAWYLRAKVCRYLTHLGLKFDNRANHRCIEKISTPSSKFDVLVIPANEELQIGREAFTLVS